MVLRESLTAAASPERSDLLVGRWIRECQRQRHVQPFSPDAPTFLLAHDGHVHVGRPGLPGLLARRDTEAAVQAIGRLDRFGDGGGWRVKCGSGCGGGTVVRAIGPWSSGGGLDDVRGEHVVWGIVAGDGAEEPAEFVPAAAATATAAAGGTNRHHFLLGATITAAVAAAVAVSVARGLAAPGPHHAPPEPGVVQPELAQA